MIRSAPGQPAADDRPEPDEPAPEHDAGRAGLDVGGVERRADSRREPAGERRAALERRLRRDLRERDLGQHRVLGERRRAHEVAHRLASAGEPRRAVREVAEALLSRIATQRFVRPLRQWMHSPHSGANNVTTWSPGATMLTPSPTLSTTPAPSCPSTHGT